MSYKDWKFYTLADAYEPRPPVTWLVGKILSLPSLTIVYGSPGALKTMLMMDMLVCVSAGLPWLEPLSDKQDGANPIVTTKAPCMWLDFDNGKRRMHERFEAISRIRNLPPNTPLSYVSMPKPWLDADNEEAVDELAEMVIERGVKLVIIDNLSAIQGTADENSSDVADVMSNLRRLVEKTGAAVVVIHHPRKGSHNGGDSLRGHSSINGSIDLALYVERKEESDIVVIKSTKTRDVKVKPFEAMFTFTHKEGTDELETAKFFGMKASAEWTSVEGIREEILAVVERTPGIDKTRLGDAVRLSYKARGEDVGVNKIRAVVDIMEKEGAIIDKKGHKGGKAYYLPEK